MFRPLLIRKAPRQ